MQIVYNTETVDVYALFRPFMKEFIEEASKLLEVVVFTASQSW